MGFFKKLFSIFKKKKKSKEDELEKEEVKKEDILEVPLPRHHLLDWAPGTSQMPEPARWAES